MYRKIYTILIILFLAQFASAQNRFHRYWIEFKDKDTTHFSIQHPSAYLSQRAIDRRIKYKIAIALNDLPVNASYVKLIAGKGVTIMHSSKWLNAVAVETANKNLIDSIKNFSFVKSVTYLGDLKSEDDEYKAEAPIDINEALSVLESKFDDGKKKNTDTNFYGKSIIQINMLNMQKLHEMGFMGQGVTIAVIDAGYKDANKLGVFSFAFDSGHVKGAHDFVEANNNVFDDDDHGVGVWSLMAAYKPYQLVGTAPKANYWLLRSEYVPTESLIEEINWLSAAEFADSVGVDIINSSLGYNRFKDSILNHRYKDLNGKTTIITRAASMAASKGILVINSAGNEGDKSWRYIEAPADANNIISVGGVDGDKMYASFSSIGPSADKRIKPNVVALGEDVWIPSTSGTIYQGSGTSYSCPIMTGVAACLLQANTERTNTEIINALQLSASQYSAPDKYVGYGIPDAVLANKFLGGDIDYALKKDIILDVRILNDGNIHVGYFSRSAQKITIVIEDAQKLKAPPILKETVNCKSAGINRNSLKTGAKILPKGIYAVYFYSKDGVSSFLLKIK